MVLCFFLFECLHILLTHQRLRILACKPKPEKHSQQQTVQWCSGWFRDSIGSNLTDFLCDTDTCNSSPWFGWKHLNRLTREQTNKHFEMATNVYPFIHSTQQNICLWEFDHTRRNPVELLVFNVSHTHTHTRTHTCFHEFRGYHIDLHWFPRNLL